MVFWILNVINVVRLYLGGDGHVFPRHQHARHGPRFINYVHKPTHIIRIFVLVIFDTSIAPTITTGLRSPHLEYIFIVDGNEI